MVMVIEVEGGLIQNIEGIPQGMTVEVHNYDLEGFEDTDDRIRKDDNGREFILSVKKGVY